MQTECRHTDLAHPGEESSVTTYGPPFGSAHGPWAPALPGSAIATRWSPPARRVIIAHAVLWPGVIFLDIAARWWQPPLEEVVAHAKTIEWSTAFIQASFGGILALPLVVAVLMVGRSITRIALSIVLILLSIVPGSVGGWLPDVGDTGSAVIFSAASGGIVLAWIVARRRNMLGMLGIVITVAVQTIIRVGHVGPRTHAIIWDGQFDLGPALGQFAVFALTIVVPAWVAVGIDALTGPKNPHAGISSPGPTANPFTSPTSFGVPGNTGLMTQPGSANPFGGPAGPPPNSFGGGYPPPLQPPSWPGQSW